MTNDDNSGPIPGWVGGFSESNPAFAYPHPDLTSLPMLDNLANIDLLQRQQPVEWPEFSWLTVQGDNNSRCFQMFAPYISRLGYTDNGRVYSIICPQQGACSPSLGCMNVEVTVTAQRGWANESTKEIAADMTVEGKIWFSPSANEKPLLKLLFLMFEQNKRPFPFSKANAIVVSTHQFQNPAQPIFPLLNGQSTRFPVPEFAKHPQAWSVGNLDVQIGPIKTTGDVAVDDFNELVMEIFNTASGNMLQSGNTLSWNVWFTPPVLVNTAEWRAHAELWRQSIDADHGSPDGPGTDAKYFDGSPFNPEQALVEQETEKILAYLRKHL